MNKKKKIIIILIVFIVLAFCCSILYFANQYSDKYKTNLFSAIFCIVSLISAIVIGFIAYYQNVIYDKRQKKQHENEYCNIKLMIKNIVEYNSKKISDYESLDIFNLVESYGNYKLGLFQNFDEILPSMVKVENVLFEKLAEYNSLINKINLYINNYNLAIEKSLYKDKTEYQEFIVDNIKVLKHIEL